MYMYINMLLLLYHLYIIYELLSDAKLDYSDMPLG